MLRECGISWILCFVKMTFPMYLHIFNDVVKPSFNMQNIKENIILATIFYLCTCSDLHPNAWFVRIFYFRGILCLHCFLFKC